MIRLPHVQPLVSIILTTKNEEKNIIACLDSIKSQNYKNTEIIVVDNNSADKTQELAKEYTKFVYSKGPERSIQRNFGAEKATGKYFLFLDADMKLTKNVITECVALLEKDTSIGGVIIPEKSYGIGFWARAKALERSFYVNNDLIEAARFFPSAVFKKMRGYDLSLTGPEDWDFSQRVKEKYKLGRIRSFILHNEGHLHLLKTLQKKYYYAKKFTSYIEKHGNQKYSSQQLSVLQRYKIFFSQPAVLLKNPILSMGMLFMKTAEFSAGGASYVLSRIKQ